MRDGSPTYLGSGVPLVSWCRVSLGCGGLSCRSDLKYTNCIGKAMSIHRISVYNRVLSKQVVPIELRMNKHIKEVPWKCTHLPSHRVIPMTFLLLPAISTYLNPYTNVRRLQRLVGTRQCRVVLFAEAINAAETARRSWAWTAGGWC